MRIKYSILLLLLSIFLYSCGEELVGQPSVDSTPPGKITNPVVINTPGGAEIVYKVPSDPDLLLVRAYYNLNGEKKSVSASLYTDTLKIVGFGTTDPQTVQVRCVDRSGNEGEIVNVTVNPLTPAVEMIYETITMERASGGLKLTWKNEARAQVAIVVYASDKNGDLVEADAIYTAVPDGKYTVRGFDATERTFAVKVRDRWGNISKTKEGVFTPQFEEEVPKEGGKGAMKRYWLPFDNPTNISWENFEFWNLFDGITTGNNMFHTNYGPPMSPVYFTIDLGCLVQLGRYKLWYREGTGWGNHNPKKWRLYGTANPLPSQNTHPANDSEYWQKDADGVPPGKFATDTASGWYFLGEYEPERPTEHGGTPQDDSNALLAGFEYEVRLDLPPIRYIRFEQIVTWSGGTTDCHIAEFSFWGEIKK